MTRNDGAVRIDAYDASGRRLYARNVEHWTDDPYDAGTAYASGVWYGATMADPRVHAVRVHFIGWRVCVEMVRGSWGGPDVIYV